MRNKNIHFVGYYLGIEAKEKYVNLYDCNKKKFYEGSLEQVKQSNMENVQYFPEQIYKIKGHISYLFSNKKVRVDNVLRECYKKDLKHFQSLDIEINKISKLRKIPLFLWFCSEYFIKSSKGLHKFNPFSFLKALTSNIHSYKNKDKIFLNKFKTFIFKRSFILGYKYTQDILEKMPLGDDNIYILWGKSYSSRILLIDYLKRNNTPYIVSEYGEVAGTISCSPHGIFGEMFTNESWALFEKKKVTSKELKNTQNILEIVKKNQISTREYDNNMYFLMKYFYENSVKKEQLKKVIYVNGAELFSSGLYWNRWNIGNRGQNPNKMLLDKVVSFFDSTEYMIVYKEHPMTIQQNTQSLLSPGEFPTVNFLGSMNIHDVLDLADIIISFPSKVVMTALLYEKNTFVLGDFTIPHSIPEMRYFTSRTFDDIQEVIHNKIPYDKNIQIELISKLTKYFLIICDDKLYQDYNVNEEQGKLQLLIDSLCAA